MDEAFVYFFVIMMSMRGLFGLVDDDFKVSFPLRSAGSLIDLFLFVGFAIFVSLTAAIGAMLGYRYLKRFGRTLLRLAARLA